MTGRIEELKKIKVDLIELRKKIMCLSEEDQVKRDLYLKDLPSIKACHQNQWHCCFLGHFHKSDRLLHIFENDNLLNE